MLASIVVHLCYIVFDFRDGLRIRHGAYMHKMGECLLRHYWIMWATNVVILLRIYSPVAQSVKMKKFGSSRHGL
ncbi:hypothetical protein BDV59DRAFT_75870 [Aspergillus ambiguus]|uniref:uncharacterized protein n=1 Tax=Aspergillus ambiguus TaxID=176160 RepID=UPI003CCE4752